MSIDRDIMNEYLVDHSKADLAELCKVHRNTVARWVSGNRKLTAGDYLTIATELGYKIFLIRGEVKQIIK